MELSARSWLRDHKSAYRHGLQMASRNGIEAARTIWKERPETRILFWSNYSDEAYVRASRASFRMELPMATS